MSRIVYKFELNAEIYNGASESKEESNDSERENRPKLFQYIEAASVSILSDSFSKMTKLERAE